MSTVVIENVGAVEHLEIPCPPGGGVVVLRGRNGKGKTTALNACRKLCGDEVDLTKKDGAEKGRVEGFGAKVTVGKSARRTGGDSLEVMTLEGLDAGDLVDPGIADPVAADTTRIKAIVKLTGQRPDPELFRTVLENPSDFDTLCGDVEESDLVKLASKIKRAIQKAALETEKAADTAHGAAKAAGEAIGTVDLNGETDRATLQANLKAALAQQAAVKAKQDAYRFADEQANNAAIAMAEDAAKHETPELTLERLKLANEEHDRLQELLKAAEKEMDAAADAHREAVAYERTLAGWRESIEAATKIEQPSHEESEAAETAVRLANEAIETGALIVAAKTQRTKQIEYTTSAVANRAAAVRLRKSADKVDDVLSGLVQGIAGGIRVKNERLVIDTDRGETLFSELSEGERWKVAIDVCVDVVGSTGLMVIPQDAWEGLDPINRELIAEHARKCGVTIITAEATADEEIYAETL